MPQKEPFKISELSKHLFWDVNATVLDPDDNKRLIISRVLDYGVLNDWKIIYNYYGITTIAEILTTVKELSLPAASMVSFQEWEELFR